MCKRTNFYIVYMAFEAKYSVAFSEFAKMWENGETKEPFSYEIESDFMDWEMLEMEKKDLIAAIIQMKKAAKK